MTYTVLFIPDHNARVRRFRVSGKRARLALIAVAVSAVVGSVMAFDWARTRIQLPELHQLREEAARKDGELERLAGSVQQLEGDLARVRELERKVRVIADLPAPAEKTVGPPGVGGDDADEALPELSPEEADLGGQGGEDEPTGPDAAAAPAPQAATSRATRVAVLHARAEQLAAQVDAREKSLAKLIDELAGKSRRLASTPSIWPTRGWLTSGYGNRTSPFTGQRQFHAGIDISSPTGTAVLAPARGRVVSVGRDGALGLTVVIDHGYGVRTSYGHNSKILVAKGDEVARGQKIAAVGNTGRSTGPHLHYSVHVAGRRVNPLNYILEE
jgi:murein DD-endopeptidase MepM/ murein hydrolase activator NlpD